LEVDVVVLSLVEAVQVGWLELLALDDALGQIGLQVEEVRNLARFL
jgi:hypothetical protein